MHPFLLPLSRDDIPLSFCYPNASSFVTSDQAATGDLDSKSAHHPLDSTITINPFPSPPPEPSSLVELTPNHEHHQVIYPVWLRQNQELPASPTAACLSVRRPVGALRLPSFTELGITLPAIEASLLKPNIDDPDVKPARQDSRSFCKQYSRLSELPPSPVADEPVHSLSAGSAKPDLSTISNFPLAHTPPDDTGSLTWGTADANTAAGPAREQPPSLSHSYTTHGVASDLVKRSGMASQAGFGLGSSQRPWLTDALSSILDSVHQHTTSDALKILSNALPSPSAEGHAFPTVIESIQRSTSSSSIMWMNVWHAVSGRFKFEDLPKSPPSTPAPPLEGDDYFTQRVFDYAVEVPDYSQKLAAQPLTSRLQRPAIAPHSIDISIVERYIPPTSTAEFEELFSATGRSFLSDRLIEISPSHGSLLFIYPTKAGGDTFLKKYLDPVLAPTLRSMMISHDLPQNLAEAVGTMTAVAHLPSFEDMKSQLLVFLHILSEGGGTTPNAFRLPGTTYELMYAEPCEVHLDRKVWAKDWWSKQEKLRIQRAFETHDVQSATHTRQAGAFQAHEHIAIATRETHEAAQSQQAKLIQRAQTQALLREAERSRGERHPGDNEQMILRLMEQIITRDYPSRTGPPEQGVEVGVFVIQKRFRS